MDSKIPLLSFVMFSVLVPFLTEAAIDPVYKECSQRGYEIMGDYCVFPDSTKCLLEEFNNRQCGQKWMTDDYCIPEGRNVWDSEKCCEGLVAYLPEGMAGQATCESKTATFFKRNFVDSYVGVLMLLFALGAVLLFLKRRKRKA